MFPRQSKWLSLMLQLKAPWVFKSETQITDTDNAKLEQMNLIDFWKHRWSQLWQRWRGRKEPDTRSGGMWDMSGSVTTDIYSASVTGMATSVHNWRLYEYYIDANSDPWHKREIKKETLNVVRSRLGVALETVYWLEFLNTRWQFDTGKYCFLQAL